MGSGVSRTIIGAYVGTGAALTIEIHGQRPKALRFVNLTTGAGSTAEWQDTMVDGTVVTHDSGADAIDSSNGITPTDKGFTVGTNAVINTSGEEIHYTMSL